MVRNRPPITLLWDERLQRFRDADVLLISALIQIELFFLERIELGADERRATRGRELMLCLGCLHLVRRVVHPFPREPVRAPLSVRRLQELGCERKRRAGRAIERIELFRKKLACGPRERLPDQERSRILLRRASCRERGEEGGVAR